MALTNAALNAMANHLGTLVTHVSLHSANPGTGGANETTAARQAVSWTTAANGDISITVAENFTGGASNGACTYVGLQGASSGGTFYGSFPLSGDQTFNSAGEYTLDSLTIDGS